MVHSKNKTKTFQTQRRRLRLASVLGDRLLDCLQTWNPIMPELRDKQDTPRHPKFKVNLLIFISQSLRAYSSFEDTVLADRCPITMHPRHQARTTTPISRSPRCADKTLPEFPRSLCLNGCFKFRTTGHSEKCLPEESFIQWHQ